MLFSFDVEQMAASAQEKTPAGLTIYELSLDAKGLFVSYFPPCLALSPEAVFVVIVLCRALP